MGRLKMEMTFGIDTLLTIIAGICGFATIWTQLNSRLAILETKHDFAEDRFAQIDKKFDEVVQHLIRIEKKLDHKADR